MTDATSELKLLPPRTTGPAGGDVALPVTGKTTKTS